MSLSHHYLDGLSTANQIKVSTNHYDRGNWILTTNEQGVP